MGYHSDELEYWKDFATAMGNEEFRKLFAALLQRTIEEDNHAVAREGLQNPHVNSLQYTEGNSEL